MKNIQAKKSLGQNFLIDKNVIHKIINSFGIRENDTVLEIGPGMGALTEHLLELSASLTAVEFDSRAVAYLENKFPADKYPFFRLLNEDILKVNINDYFDDELKAGKKLKVIGNIPYNISSEIIFYLIDNRDNIEKAQLMLQKEVALRLCAEPGNKTYGITTVAVNLTGHCRYLFDVASDSFNPKPKVTSAIVELEFDRSIESTEFYEIMKLVRTLFNQRRKQLRNTLKNYLKPRVGGKTDLLIKKIDGNNPFFLNNRPEVLSYNDFVDLYKEIVIFLSNE
jgi:16S rRNA (adenine1518-N6/adenine1519-N6)-dimethyltransferase